MTKNVKKKLHGGFLQRLMMVISFCFVACVGFAQAPAVADPANWMSKLDGEMYFCNMTIPAAHDAATHAAIIANPWTKDQMSDEKELFAMGVRGFDMRLGAGNRLWHGNRSSIICAFNSFEDEFNNHFPSKDKLENEFMWLNISSEHGAGWSKDDATALQEKKDANKAFMTELLKFYPGVEFVRFRKDLQWKDMKGKIMLLIDDDFCDEDFLTSNFGSKYIGKSFPVTKLKTINGYNYFIDSKEPSNSENKIRVYRQNDYGITNGEEKFDSIKTDYERFFKDFTYPNHGDRMAYFNYNGYDDRKFSAFVNIITPFIENEGQGGISVAAATTFHDGANELTYNYLKNKSYPLGIVAFDFCGASSYGEAHPFGDYVLNLLINQNNKKGFIESLMAYAIDKPEDGTKGITSAEKYFAKEGYYRITEDMNSGTGDTRIYIGAKYTDNPKDAICDIYAFDCPEGYTGGFDGKPVYQYHNDHYYRPIAAYSPNDANYNGNLNKGAGKRKIFLLAGYNDDPNVDDENHLTGLSYHSSYFGGNKPGEKPVIGTYSDDEGKWNDKQDFNRKDGTTTDYVYLGKILHSHSANEKMSYDDNSHHQYCYSCGSQMTQAQAHDYNVELAVYGIHVASCKLENCGFRKAQLCFADTYDDNGFGTCKICGKEAYQKPECENGVYKISNPGNLYWYASNVNFFLDRSDAVLTRHINLACDEKERQWIPIGSTVNSDVVGEIVSQEQNSGVSLSGASGGYSATFDGQGYTISGLNVRQTADDGITYYGLFGYIHAGTLKNLGIINSSFTASEYVGSFAGYVNDGTLTNLYSTADIIKTVVGPDAGGIYGYFSPSIKGTFKNGFFAGNFPTTGTDKNYANLPLGPKYTKAEVDNVYVKSNTYNKLYLNGAKEIPAEDFASGRLCYLLNTNDDAANDVWFQHIDVEAIPSQKSFNTYELPVFGGYKHGSTEMYFTNGSYYHSHAYDPTADTEADGNHDMSYEEKSEKWTDNEDKTWASLKVSFHCPTCLHDFTPENIVVTNDENKPNSAPCVETGHNYYKYSYTFNDKAVYTTTYDQELTNIYGSHDFTQHTLSDHPIGWKKGDADDKLYQYSDALYNYVCARDHNHVKDGYIKVLKDFTTSGDNLEVTTENYTKNKVDHLDLTDANQFKGIDKMMLIVTNGAKYTRSMKNQWGTLVLPFNVNADNEAYNLYAIESITDDVITLSKITGTLFYGNPCLVHMNGEPDGGLYTLRLTAAATGGIVYVYPNSKPYAKQIAGSDISLTGTQYPLDITEENGYIISAGKFWDIHDLAYDAEGNRKKDGAKDISVVNFPFHAYLAGTSSSGVKAMSISLGEETAVEAINAMTSGEAQYYDTSGRRMPDMQRGLNIVKYGNGKTRKVIIK